MYDAVEHNVTYTTDRFKHGNFKIDKFRIEYELSLNYDRTFVDYFSFSISNYHNQIKQTNKSVGMDCSDLRAIVVSTLSNFYIKDTVRFFKIAQSVTEKLFEIYNQCNPSSIPKSVVGVDEIIYRC